MTYKFGNSARQPQFYWHPKYTTENMKFTTQQLRIAIFNSCFTILCSDVLKIPVLWVSGELSGPDASSSTESIINVLRNPRLTLFTIVWFAASAATMRLALSTDGAWYAVVCRPIPVWLIIMNNSFKDDGDQFLLRNFLINFFRLQPFLDGTQQHFTTFVLFAKTIYSQGCRGYGDSHGSPVYSAIICTTATCQRRWWTRLFVQAMASMDNQQTDRQTDRYIQIKTAQTYR